MFTESRASYIIAAIAGRYPKGESAKVAAAVEAGKIERERRDRIKVETEKAAEEKRRREIQEDIDAVKRLSPADRERLKAKAISQCNVLSVVKAWKGADVLTHAGLRAQVVRLVKEERERSERSAPTLFNLSSI